MIKFGEKIAALGTIITFGGVVWCVALSTGPIWVPIIGIGVTILGLDIMTDGER